MRPVARDLRRSTPHRSIQRPENPPPRTPRHARSGTVDAPPALRLLTRQTLDREGKRVAYDNRYFVSSLGLDEPRPRQWLYAVRLHWAVENNCHNTWDTAFEEDERPWIQAHPRATVVVMILRRIAYDLLTWFRSVTQRSEDKRQVPWKARCATCT